MRNFGGFPIMEPSVIALGLTAMATFTYGFLEVFVGVPNGSMFAVFPFKAACFSLSLPFVHRRCQ